MLASRNEQRPRLARVVNFETFYREHVQLAARVARQVVGDGPDLADVVQNVFLAVFLHRVEIGCLDNPSAWVATLARRAALDLAKMRRRRGKREVAMDVEVAAPQRGWDSDEEEDSDRQAERVRTAMEHHLTENDRELLRRIMASSAAKVAAADGRHAAAVRGKKRRIIALLRKLLKGK